MRSGLGPDGVVRAACIIDGGGGGTDKYSYSCDFFSDVVVSVVLLVLMLIRFNLLVVFRWCCHSRCMDDCGVVSLYL